MFHFIEILFYSMSGFAIMYEIDSFLWPSKALARDVELFITPKGERTINQIKYATWVNLYGMWGTVGLFTSQWIYFLLLMVLSFTSASVFLLNKRTKNLVIIDSLMSLLIICLMILHKTNVLTN